MSIVPYLDLAQQFIGEKDVRKYFSKSHQKTLNAIANKDTQAIFDAGSEIDSACEACHIQYAKFDQKALSLGFIQRI